MAIVVEVLRISSLEPHLRSLARLSVFGALVIDLWCRSTLPSMLVAMMLSTRVLSQESAITVLGLADIDNDLASMLVSGVSRQITFREFSTICVAAVRAVYQGQRDI